MNSLNTYILGIDIGGTHIDIVAVNAQEEIIASHKQAAFKPIEEALLCGIRHLLTHDNLQASHCKAIHLGTTMAVNSLLELKSLYRVGILRLAGHHPELPPAFNWPQAKKDSIIAGVKTIHGGFEYDKTSLSTLDMNEVTSAVEQLRSQGAESLAIIGVFSPLYSEEETQVGAFISSHHPNIPVTLSHEVGGLGFVERESNAIINATLQKVMRDHFHHVKEDLTSLDFKCDLLITQNNGTLLSLDDALSFPIRTVSSGPTNSLIGASKLAQCHQAIVIDIGGTSTDIGVIENGFPRYSSAGATIAGIATSFMLPSIQVLALGGGSIIHQKENKYTIGPESIAEALFSKSQSYHGDILTPFDAGNVLQKIVPEHGTSPHLSYEDAQIIMQDLVTQLETATSSIFIDQDTPVILVGGGAQNIPESYLNERMKRPNHYQVANAYGAALAEVCGSIDVIRQLAHHKQAIMDELEQEAIEQALTQGACINSIRIIEKRLLPFYYMDNQLTRIIITAAGRKST